VGCGGELQVGPPSTKWLHLPCNLCFCQCHETVASRLGGILSTQVMSGPLALRSTLPPPGCALRLTADGLLVGPWSLLARAGDGGRG
jgi:hypothetical protein